MNKDTKTLLTLSVVSFILSNFSIGSLVFTLPLLFIYKRYPERNADTACVAVMVLVLAQTLYDFIKMSDGNLTYLFVLVMLYIPISLMLGAVVWGKTKGVELDKRLFLLLLAPLGVFLIFVVLFVLDKDGALLVSNNYSLMTKELLSQMMGLDSTEDIYFVVEYLVLSCIVFIAYMNILFVSYISSLFLQKDVNYFNFRIATFKVSYKYLNVFLTLLALFIVSYVISFPMSIRLIINNATLCFASLYFVQGIAILYFKIRKAGSNMNSSRLLPLGVLFLLLPGINTFIFLAFTIIGFAENWIKIRKRD